MGEDIVAQGFGDLSGVRFMVKAAYPSAWP